MREREKGAPYDFLVPPPFPSSRLFFLDPFAGGCENSIVVPPSSRAISFGRLQGRNGALLPELLVGQGAGEESVVEIVHVNRFDLGDI